MPQILIGKGEQPCFLDTRYANRHGLIAGATGTGKTVTLQIMAEGFSSLGVPVLLADIKGDLAGLAIAGQDNQTLKERAKALGDESYQHQAYPVVFWDLFGRDGHPVRATITDLGPLLLSRLLGLNATQDSVLSLLFKVAKDQNLLLLNLKDLQSLLIYAAEHTQDLSKNYGAISKQSIGIIQRGLLALESEGAGQLFGEPALAIEDLFQTTLEGRGQINILAADKLFQKPKLYATFLLWLLTQLQETLPEQGDQERPKLAFFFDEAHLLFDDAPKALLEKIEQVVRLIRSKGVGVYFITQNPMDVPESILGQLGNRVQHALRAFTPKDQKAVKVAAETFRQNPRLDVATTITELAVGEALISTLMEGGIPAPVERAKVVPPRSRMGTISPEERQTIMARSPYLARYATGIDRPSAHEMLSYKAAESVQPETDAFGGILEKAAKSAMSAASSELGRKVGRELIRGILGRLTKGR